MSYINESGCCCAILCDDLNGQGTPVPFYRCFEEICLPGQPVERIPVDYELDRETPYTLIGEAVICTVTPLNQFEGLALNPLCDIDTGLIVGYFAVTRSEADPNVFETLYFDTSGNSIPAQPANSEICSGTLEINLDYEEICATLLAETNIKAFRREQVTDGVVTVTFLREDGAIFTPDSWVPGQCVCQTLGEVCYGVDQEDVLYDLGSGNLTDDEFLGSIDPPTPPFTFSQLLYGGVNLGTGWWSFNIPLVNDQMVFNFLGSEIHTVQFDSITINGGPAETTLGTVFSLPATVSVGIFAGVINGLSVSLTVTSDNGGGVFDLAGEMQVTSDATFNFQFNGPVSDFRLDASNLQNDLSGAASRYTNLRYVNETIPGTDAFRRAIITCSNSVEDVTYIDALTLEEIDPVIAIFVDCISSDEVWSRNLCDVVPAEEIIPDVYALQLGVSRINFAGTVLDNGAAAGTQSVIYEHNGLIYIHDATLEIINSYDPENLAAGPTLVGPIDFLFPQAQNTVATDPTTGLVYVSRFGASLRSFDPDTLIVTVIVGNGTPAISGMAPDIALAHTITETGAHYFYASGNIYSVDPITWLATLIGTTIGELTTVDYYVPTQTFYGATNAGTLSSWQVPDGSDEVAIGPLGGIQGGMQMYNPTPPSGVEETFEFQRVYHKDQFDRITIQNHDLEGANYAVQGVVEICDVEAVSEEVVDTWPEILCDRVDTVLSLDLYTFDDVNNQTVQKLNGLTGGVLDSHIPNPAINWGHGTIYDATNNFYYLLDDVAGEWHRYDSTNIAAGSTNLGVFGGDAIVGQITFGALDPTTGFGYVGSTGTRYQVDFDTLTITSLAPHTTNGVVDVTSLSSLSITEDGAHFITSIVGGVSTQFYSVDVSTGISTYLPPDAPIVLNGADYDADTLSGFYGAGDNNLYRWTTNNASDFQIVAPIVSTGTLAVGQADVLTERTEFLRVYHKTNDIVTFQDHTVEGVDYEVQGVAEVCPIEINTPSLALSSHIHDLGSTELFTPADVPAGQQVTSLTMTVLVGVADNSVTDADGTVALNIPTGTTLTWSAEDANTLNLPQIIGAGTAGRTLVIYTTRPI